jgi:hypothetical protein
MANLEFDIKCVNLDPQGGFCTPASTNVVMTSGAGITDCTVGVTTGAMPAMYPSVFEALTAGCRQIRIIGDANATPPGGTFVEPVGFNITAGGGGPVMIYITPGVNWVWRESVIGAGGIVTTGEVLTLRGSGWGSQLTVDNDVGGGPMLTTDGTTQLFMYDLQMNSDNILSFFTTIIGVFYVRNSRISSNNNAGTPIITTTAGGRFEFHECTFNGSGNLCRMIDGSTVASTDLVVSDCVAEGTYNVLGSSFNFSTPLGRSMVNGFLCRLVDGTTATITLGGGVYSNIIGNNNVAPPLGARVAIAFASEATLADSRVANMNILVDNVRISDVELTNELTATLVTSDFNNITNLIAPGGLTLNTANFNIITGLNGRPDISPGNLNVFASNNNTVTGFKLNGLTVNGTIGAGGCRENMFGDGNCSLMTITSANNAVAPFEGNAFSNIHCNSTLTVTSTNNCQFDNVRVNTSMTEVTGGAEAGNQYSNCSFGAGSTAATIAPAIYTSERLKFSNCKFGRPVGSGAGTFYNMTFSAAADELQMTNCYISGVLQSSNGPCWFWRGIS